MEFLQDLLEASQFPMLTAFLLGLMTAISPCPMATNITAIGYIGKNLENGRSVFINGLLYTLGRAFSYTLIGVIFFLGADQLELEQFFQGWGEKVLGPILILIGLFMIGLIKISLPQLKLFDRFYSKDVKSGGWGSFMLGVLFALAFCPYSGVLYFGMLIPITVSSAQGLYLPVVYALATGIPVVVFAWLLAFSVSKLNNAYVRMKNFELWFRRIVAVAFILVGIYHTLLNLFHFDVFA